MTWGQHNGYALFVYINPSLKQLEPVNGLSKTAGIPILNLINLIIILPVVIPLVDRADSVLRFLVSLAAHDIVRGVIVYPYGVNRFMVSRKAVL